MEKEVCMKTPELILREVSMADAGAIAGNEGDIRETEARISGMMVNHQRNTPERLYHLCLGVFLKVSGEFVGWCGLDNTISTRANPVLFYVTEEAQRGMGYATQAAEAMLRYGFLALGLPVIDAGAAVDNPASVRVLEKTGMHPAESREEGFLVFSMRRDEYLRR